MEQTLKVDGDLYLDSNLLEPKLKDELLSKSEDFAVISNDIGESLNSGQIYYSADNPILLNKLNELLEKKEDILESTHMLGNILEWYFGSTTVSLNDITPDIADAENVFVHAEGLLLNLYYTFGGCSCSYSSSPQTLPYIYLVERFISFMLEAGTKQIVLVFLDCFRVYLENINPGLLIVREILLLHVKLNPNIFTYSHFIHWVSKEFQTYMDNLESTTFFIEDGSSITQEYIDDGTPISLKTALLSFGLDILSYSNVTLFYKIQRKGQKIIALSYSSTITQLFVELSREIILKNILDKPLQEPEYCKDHEYNCANEVIGNKGDEVISISQLLIHAFIKNSITTEDILKSSSDEDTLHNIELIKLFGKILLISSYLKNYVIKLLDRSKIAAICYRHKKSGDWEFLNEPCKSLEYLYFSETIKQLITIQLNDFTGNLKHINCADICDLYDPTLMEFIFLLIGEMSLVKNNKLGVTAETLGFSENQTIEMENFWSEVNGNSSSLFPIVLDGILSSYTENVDLSIQEAINSDIYTGEKPSLLPLRSKFVNRVMSELGVRISDLGQLDSTDIDTKNIPSKETALYLEDIMEIVGIRDVALWEIERPQETRPTYRFDNVCTSGISAELQRKRKLRDNQRNQQFWFDLGQLLTGNERLHQAIVVNPFHVWNTCNELSPNKITNNSLSSKAEEIRRKNEQAKSQKMQQDDDNQLKQYEIRLNQILAKGDPDSFMLAVYDMLIGLPRRTNEFNRFKALSRSFKLPKSRCKILIKTIQTCMSVIRSFKCSTLPDANHLVSARSAICMTFRIIIETFNQYYDIIDKNDFGEMIKALLQIGFTTSAKNMITLYKYKMQEKSNIELSNKKAKENSKTETANKKGKQNNTNNRKRNKNKTEGNIAEDKDGYLREVEKMVSEMESLYISLPNSGKYDKLALHIKEGLEAAFQLRYMGADFERSTGSIVDPRVLFLPDYWQKYILDIIDKGDSALVCAPTASGKTFICYYAMEQVLRYDNESVVVFVAPTKALADQVHAEISYRFGSKTYPNHSKISLFCKLSRDYSINIPTQCQILITLPYMLELLLMSSVYQSWVSKIKFVIFDEVHCINESEGGVYWERILQLIPCQYLCLSATIGNPYSFYNWLQKIKKTPNSQVHLVTYNERYADLSTLIYHQGDLYPLNPVLALSYERILNYELPGDFYLTPADCLDLYLAISKIIKKDEQKEAFEQYVYWLDPDMYFNGTLAITKKQYRFYLVTILNVMVQLVRRQVITKESWTYITRNLLLTPSLTYQRKLVQLAKESDCDMYDIVMNTGNNGVLRSCSSKTNSDLFNSKEFIDNIRKSEEVLVYSQRLPSAYKLADDLLEMIRKVQSENLLPCIIFNMERSVVEHLGQSLIGKLEKDHHYKYCGTKEAIQMTKTINRRRYEQYLKDIQRRDMLLKLKTMSRQQRERQGIIIDESEIQSLENLKEPIDISEEYDAEFFLCDRKVMGGREREIQDLISSCEGKISPIFIEGLRRGIGIHHDGLSLRYRRAVDTLYRIGYLLIIISTRTLALGVNMPCRTAVFVNDSITLTPLLYRQASGRAGRRGYDIQGNIIFWDISARKRNRLLTSELPTLTGNFPVTPTTVLRTFMLFNSILNEQSRQNITKERAIISLKALVKFFKDPLYSVGHSQEFHNKLIASQFRFTVDFLQRSQVLNAHGICTGYSGIISHMFEFEGTNLLLVKLIQSGIIFKYLFDEGSTEQYSAENTYSVLKSGKLLLTSNPVQRLLVLLAHISICKPMTKNCLHHIRNQLMNSSSSNLRDQLYGGKIQPLLLTLPKYVQSCIDKYNNSLFESTKNSLITTCTDMDYEEYEYKLPLSNHYLRSNSDINGGSILQKFFNSFESTNSNICIQTPFMSLLGCKDADIRSPQQLIYNTRSKLNCTSDLLTCIDSDSVVVTTQNISGKSSLLNSDVYLTVTLLNSFLVDFYETQRFSEIIRKNYIPVSEVFFLILDFKVLLDRFLYSFSLTRQDMAPATTSLYKNLINLNETLQSLYNTYRIIAAKNDA
ncbi:DEAD DEAH box helicase [Cryptosporidium andersoni]|uniref:DEAD DEAH box helicase n=1 Tax=Cryptosporidium andersoni TaxID=117008 RepID=A0A1J4MYH0_9CRYT|nr:DEAD DEAH box helicase [Cryptosporidium andersoni]